MDVVIDTNVFYDLMEISTNNKFKRNSLEKYINRPNNCFITTTSLSEVVVKLKDNKELLKKCIEPIIKEEIKILRIAFTPIESNIIKKIYNAADNGSNNNIDEIIEEVFKSKFKAEKCFLSFFFISALWGIFTALEEKGAYSFSKNSKKHLIITNALVSTNIEFINNSFEDALKIGYRNDDVEKVIKNRFSELLNHFLELWIINYYIVEVKERNEGLTNTEYIKEIDELLQKDRNFLKIKEQMENPALLIKRKKFQQSVMDYVIKSYPVVEMHQYFNIEVASYVARKIQYLLNKGAKMKKNDILDMMILYAIRTPGLKEPIIISYDKDTINFLKEHHHKSYQAISNILR